MDPAHPVEALRGRKGAALAGRTIALGIDAARGAPGAVRVARELVRHGAEVHPLVVPAALDWVPAVALEYAAGHAPAAWPTHASYDAVLLAPVGPGLLQKLRLAVPDTAPAAAALAHLGRVPVLAAPAPGVASEALEALGLRVVDGFDAFGEPRPEPIAAGVAGALSASPLRGRKVLVVAGGALSPWDAMRVVGTRGDAARARALALDLQARGVEVTLALGPWGAPHRDTEHAYATPQDLAALLPALGTFDLAFLEDAFPALAPAEVATAEKLPSGQRGLVLALRAAPSARDLVARVAARVVTYRGEASAAVVAQAEAALA